MSLALITGSSGHVGSNLIRELTKQNYKIRCIDFDGDHRAYEGFDVEIIKGDITKSDLYKLMPFENELVVLELNKTEICYFFPIKHMSMWIIEILRNFLL